MVANGSARPAMIAMCVGLALGGTLSAALALSDRMTVAPVDGDRAVVAEPAPLVGMPVVNASALRADPDCHLLCSSVVIAGPRPGEPALVVDGSSAFGMALDAGAARISPTIPEPPPLVPAIEVPAPAETMVSAHAAVSIGASAAFSGPVETDPSPVGLSGGWAIADASSVMAAPFK
jgi:hypothetical protein